MVLKWYKNEFITKTRAADVLVLYNLVTDRYLTLDPVADKYSEVDELEKLKTWDWQYTEVAEIAWASIVAEQRGIVIRKLTAGERRRARRKPRWKRGCGKRS